jgi:hypothetical protein
MQTPRSLGAAFGKRHVSGGEIDVLEPTWVRKVWWAFGNEHVAADLALVYGKKYNDAASWFLTALAGAVLQIEALAAARGPLLF